MVRENITSKWEAKYEIIPSNIPNFLSRVSNEILRAGKYLNVIQECGKSIVNNNNNDESLVNIKISDESHLEVIKFAYTSASSALLKLIMDENDLLGRLLSVKRYFLLQQGDFLEQFLDVCEVELQKEAEKVTPMKIEKLLELTLRLSSAKNDKYQDNLKIVFFPYTIQNQVSRYYTDEDDDTIDFDEALQLKGLESFSFGYIIDDWPVSIVLNQIALSKYQMIFRLLYFCKHTERQLCKNWSRMKVKSTKFDISTRTLCQRMMNVIQNVEYYMMFEVIEPNFHTLLDKLKKVNNIDEVLYYHHHFLETCLHDCMLTNPTLLNSIFNLCNLSLEFCDLQQKPDDANPTISKIMVEFSNRFEEEMHKFLKLANAAYSTDPTEKFVNLIHRFNFNHFYDDKTMKAC